MSILLLLAILPVFFIGMYIYKKDREKEPIKMLLMLLLFGAISCIPAVILEMLVGRFFPEMEEMGFIQLFIYVFIGIAFVEELCKLFMLYIYGYDHVELSNVYDMILYATFVSLGFALLENILYVLDGGIVVGIGRALLSVPGHACNGVVMGYYVGLSKIALVNKQIDKYKKNLLLGLFIPSIMHTIFNFCLFYGKPIFLILFLGYVIIVYIICIKIIKFFSKSNVNIFRRN